MTGGHAVGAPSFRFNGHQRANVNVDIAHRQRRVIGFYSAMANKGFNAVARIIRRGDIGEPDVDVDVDVAGAGMAAVHARGRVP